MRAIDEVEFRKLAGAGKVKFNPQPPRTFQEPKRSPPQEDQILKAIQALALRPIEVKLPPEPPEKEKEAIVIPAPQVTVNIPARPKEFILEVLSRDGHGNIKTIKIVGG